MTATVIEKKPGQVYTIHSLDEIEIETRLRANKPLDQLEARALTEEINKACQRVWLLVTEAHDRKAHKALGYETWADYAKAELGMSESRSYQFLDAGHVMKALCAAGVDIESVPTPPVRVVNRIKNRLGDVKRVATAAVKNGDSVGQALRDLAREPSKGGDSASSAASAGGGEDVTKPEAGTERVAPNKKVSCPACAGSGRVTKSVSDRLLDILSKMK